MNEVIEPPTKPSVTHVWIFDINRRVYPPAQKGKIWADGGPIYREHWVKHEVTGETRVSWITRYGAKVPKKGGPGIALSLTEVEDAVWLHDHKYKIARCIELIRDASLLRAVADAAGYKPDSEP